MEMDDELKELGFAVETISAAHEELINASKATYQIFRGFVDAGFSESQALWLIKSLLVKE